MAKLIYSMQMSLDGYVADRDGGFDWTFPTPEIHRFINDLSRPISTFLLGRRMYEVLRVWDDISGPEPELADFASIWKGAGKIVYSRSLESVSTARTELRRSFDVDEVRALDGETGIGGPELAGHALRAGLVDECQFFFAPVIVGGGTSAFPRDAFVNLDLAEQRRFENGVVFARYNVRGGQ